MPYELWEYVFKISEAEILSEILKQQKEFLEYSFTTETIEKHRKNIAEAQEINKRRFLTILN
jgi:hypothetical protein